LRRLSVKKSLPDDKFISGEPVLRARRERKLLNESGFADIATVWSCGPRFAGDLQKRKESRAMTKEVKIELTEAQKAKIKAATGKNLSELKVTSVGKNVAVSTSETSTRISEQGLREEGMRSIEEQGMRGAEIGESALREEGLREEGMRSIEEQGMRGAEIEESALREEGLREEGLREEGLREEGLREEGLRDEDF
jgi:hypothetical protein